VIVMIQIHPNMVVGDEVDSVDFPFVSIASLNRNTTFHCMITSIMRFKSVHNPYTSPNHINIHTNEQPN